jgi:O-antigen ligase
LKYTKFFLLASLVAYPALTLAVKKSNSVIFYLLLLIGLTAIAVRRRNEYQPFSTLKAYWPLHLSMASMALAVVPYQIANLQFEFHPYDVPLRIACFVILLYLFLRLQSRDLRLLQFGLVASVFINLVVIYIATNGGELRPAKVHFLGIIPFSNHAMLLAFLALLSIKWHDHASKVLTAFKIFAAFAGLYITFLSQSRGGWFVLPLYLAIVAAAFLHHSRKATMFLITVTLVGMVSVGLFSKNIQSRIELVKTETASYMNGSNADTSIGLRFQFWKSALYLIEEHPLVGIGEDGYRDAMAELVKKNIVTPLAATYPHCHNEVLFQTVRYGVFGLVSILLTLFVPFCYFMKDVRHADIQARGTAWMGATFCVAIMTFGLTDVVLVWRETTTFYVFFIAVLFAHLIKRKQECRDAASA